MKVRLDFVTNSSSSSYIIGKCGKTGHTVENTFQMLKNLYKDYIEKFEKTKVYILENQNSGLTLYKKNDYESFSLQDGIRFGMWEKISKKYKKNFGFDPYGWFITDTIRMIPTFKTYAEYQEYWMKQVSEATDNYVEAPFTICNLRDKNGIKTISNEGDWYEENGEYKVTRSAKYYVQDLSEDCFLLDWYADEIKKKNKKKGKEITEPCYELLGQVCIYSESSNIPMYIVEQLEKMSEFSDMHMG